MQTASSSRTRPTSSSISALLRQHPQPNNSTSEDLSPSFWHIPLSLRHSSSIETSFTVHSYPRYTHLIGEQESVSFLGAINAADVPYHKLEENSGPPTPDPFHYPLRLDIQITIHTTQDLRYHILAVNKIKNVCNNLLFVVIEK